MDIGCEYINLTQYGPASETDVYGFPLTQPQAAFENQQPLDLSQSWLASFTQQSSQTTIAYSANQHPGNYDQNNFFLPPEPGLYVATDPSVIPLDNSDESMALLPSETHPSDKRLSDGIMSLDLEARYQQPWDNSAIFSPQDSSTTVSPSSNFEDLPASSQESLAFPLLSSPISNEITSAHVETTASGNAPYYTPESHWSPCPGVRSDVTLATTHSATKLALSITNDSSISESNTSIRACSPENDRGGFKALGAGLCVRNSCALVQPEPKATSNPEAQVRNSRAKQKISKPKANGQVKTLPAAVFRCHLEPCVSGSKGGKFRREEHLKRHFLSVHGDTWHFCRYCSKAFKGRSDNRGAHEKRHFKNTGRTQYVSPEARRARR